MKRVAIFLAVAFCVVTSAAAAPTQITLLHINDTHSRLAPFGPKDANLDGTIGGLTKAASIIATEKLTNPNALVVHAGDFFEGDLFFNEYDGVAELQLLQAIGLDVLLPGNHEFHLTPAFLAGVIDASHIASTVSIVGTNIDTSGCVFLSQFIAPTAIKVVGGVKVGFFGLSLPPESDISEQLGEPPCVVAIGNDFNAAAQQAVAQLRADGAQVIVGLAHLGMTASQQIAETVGGIDVIVNAHDHVALAEPEQIVRPGGGTTLIVSAGALYQWVGRLQLSVDGGQVTSFDYTLFEVDANTPEVSDVKAYVTGLEAGIVARYGDVYHHAIGFAEVPIVSSWDPRRNTRDTPIGNLFTDGYRAWTGTDIAIEALANLDISVQSLPQGAIVPVDVYRTMGYGIPELDPVAGRYIVRPLSLATFSLTGAQLLAGLEFGVGPGGEFLQVSGMRFIYSSDRPAGHRIVAAQVGGEELNPEAVYTVTANEGVLLFLPYIIGSDPSDVVIWPESAVDAVITLIEQRGILDAGKSGRIRDVAPVGYPGRRQ